MRIISKERLHHLREKYPVGCRVELLRMDDIQAPVIGTKGTVIGVDGYRLNHGVLGHRV